jgi:hypothetical protein
MTAPRRQRNKLARASLRACLLAGGLLATSGSIAVHAATTELVVADRHTGLAISGFDPVAYFIDGVALPGKLEFECEFAGAVWRFRNEGNRAAFIAEPQAYMPRFGGYDPTGVARGVAVPGNPRFWLISADHLYLFRSWEARDAFAGRAPEVAATAESKWPAVQLTLSP